MKAGNDTEDMNIDDFNIKYHLNASFDVSGIKVSEELIQKTLGAINDQPSTEVEKEKGILRTIRFPRNSYVRNLTSVVAALIILIGGYSLIKNNIGMKSTKNDSNISMNNDRSTEMAMPEAKGEFSDKDQGLFSVEENEVDDVAMESATEDTTLIDEDDNTIGTASLDDSVKTNEQEQLYNAAASELYSSGSEGVEFTRIYGGAVDVIESMVITDDAANKSVIIAEESEISKVYSILDSYLYTAAESGLSSESYFSIEIKEYQSDAINTITIGDTITISSDTGVTDSTQAYKMINLEEFNHELKVLIESYSN